MPIAAHAQDSAANQVKRLSTCHDTVFKRFKDAFEKHNPGQTVEVDASLRLEFLKSVISFKGGTNYWIHAGAFVFVGIIYEIFQKKIFEKSYKVKPIKDHLEAADWDSRVKYLKDRVVQLDEQIGKIQDEVNKYAKASTADEKLALNTNQTELQRLEKIRRGVLADQQMGEKYIESFDQAIFKNETAVNKWKLRSWDLKFTTASFLVLMILLFGADFGPHFVGANDNNIPTDLEDLYAAETVKEFEDLLSYDNQKVEELRQELLYGCQKMLAIDLNQWWEAGGSITAGQILSELRDVNVKNTKHPLKVKVTPKPQQIGSKNP